MLFLIAVHQERIPLLVDEYSRPSLTAALQAWEFTTAVLSTANQLERDMPDRDEWWERGACKGYPTDWWFPEARPPRAEALKLCEGCPVKKQCLDECRRVEEPGYRFGVWGGMTVGARLVAWDGHKPPASTVRTHCAAGHEFTEDNVINHGNGRRRCKACADTSPHLMRNRTHCANGHELTKDNVRMNGTRTVCRKCANDATKAYAKRRKEAV